MSMTEREFWTVIHGLVLGTLYLLAFAGGFAGLLSLRPGLLTEEGVRDRLRQLKAGTWTMMLTSWLTVISGTYLVYIWYRAKIPESPRSRLLADPLKAAWHNFGMEWKEHVSWLTPILMTAVAFLVSFYDAQIFKRQDIRQRILWLYVIAFLAAAVGGVFGAFINKVAPIL